MLQCRNERAPFLDAWDRDHLPSAAIDISSSGVEAYQFGELRHLLALGHEELDEVDWMTEPRTAWRRGGLVRLVIARVKYRVGELADDTTPAIGTAEMPGELVVRSIAAPSLLAHVVSDKLCDGLPLHRQEDRFARLGTQIDRGTMSRWG